MKTKVFLLGSVLMVLTSFVGAQTKLNISKSEIFSQSKSTHEQFFGCIGDNLYSIEHKKDAKYDNITVFDADLKVIASEPVQSDNEDKQIIKPVILWNKIYMISLLNQKKSDQTSVSMECYDPKTLKYLNQNTEIFSAGYIKFDAETKFNPSLWYFSVSPDSSKIAFGFYFKESLYLSVIDKDLKEVWKSVIPMDKDRLSAKVNNLRVLNNGDVFLLFLQYKGSVQLNIIDYIVYCVTANGKTIKSKAIPNDDPLFDCALYISKDSKAYLTGMYKKLGLQKPEGFFLNEIDMKTAGYAKENKWAIKNPIYPEKLSIKQKLKVQDEDFKKVKDSDKYRHKIEILELNTGEYYFIIEQYKKNLEADPNDIDYSYDNVYVNYVNTKTNKNWDQLLAKSIRTNMTDRLSYVSFSKNGELYLFYNDCEENIDKTKDTDISEFFMSKDCTLKVLYAKYSKEGFVEKKKLTEAENLELTRNFRALSQDGNSLYLKLWGTDGKTKNWDAQNTIFKLAFE